MQIGDIGEFTAYSYTTVVDELEHLVLVQELRNPVSPYLGECIKKILRVIFFRSNQSASRWKLEYALRKMEEEGCGVLVYLQKNAPKVSAELDLLSGKTPATAPVDKGAIGLPKNLREFGIGAQILLDQGIRQLSIITSQSAKIKGLEGYGLSIVNEVIIPPRNQD